MALQMHKGDIFGGVNFVPWAWGGTISFTCGKMVPEIFPRAEEEGEQRWRDVGLPSGTARHRKCANRPSFPETCYKNDKLQVTDPLLRISAKLLVLKPKEKTKRKFSQSQ